jgi:hypothetical protein
MPEILRNIARKTERTNLGKFVQKVKDGVQLFHQEVRAALGFFYKFVGPRDVPANGLDYRNHFWRLQGRVNFAFHWHKRFVTGGLKVVLNTKHDGTSAGNIAFPTERF